LVTASRSGCDLLLPSLHLLARADGFVGFGAEDLRTLFKQSIVGVEILVIVLSTFIDIQIPSAKNILRIQGRWPDVILGTVDHFLVDRRDSWGFGCVKIVDGLILVVEVEVGGGVG